MVSKFSKKTSQLWQISPCGMTLQGTSWGDVIALYICFEETKSSGPRPTGCFDQEGSVKIWG